MADKPTYPPEALERARHEALEYIEGASEAHPRSWAQEAANTARRGYEMYDDFEAPPIAGYEALEAEGLVHRLETASHFGEERVHFKLTATPKAGERG